MATANLVSFFTVAHPIITTQRNPSSSLARRSRLSRNGLSPSSLRRSTTTICASGADFFGDFGARDPFPAELESGFGEKVLGNMNTEHKILIPNISALSLSHQECSPVSPLQQPISHDDAQNLVRKVNTSLPLFFSALFVLCLSLDAEKLVLFYIFIYRIY